MDSMKTPRVLLSSTSKTFDPVIIRHWREEGFAVSYLPFNGQVKDHACDIHSVANGLEFGEKFALIAYEDAAASALEACQKPIFNLCGLVCYYPTKIPVSSGGPPPSLEILLHTVGPEKQTKSYRSYTYPDDAEGFAEVGHAAYSKPSARLAWSRTLALVKKGSKHEVPLEDIWEQHLALEFQDKDVDATMDRMVAEPYVNHIPTMTGGLGYKNLHRFYKDFFIPSNPPSTKIKLISRTIGTDTVVDEMHISFRHTHEIHWMLPGVKPTNKEVEVALVAVVRIRGTKLYYEHIYWDQASVLVQIGLLDPKLLPVVGGASAGKALDEESEPSNGLIKDW